MKKLPFTGSGVALITPFNADGTPNYEKLDEILEMHIRNKPNFPAFFFHILQIYKIIT